ncbi:hypothetical protein DFH94DRAFT_3537 [Russula ochroleuca]|uniref:F-box domain-containing protein n=2 Tax=Russula ochroleuca TaxID=152965 RepID=A0A9P5TE70_9AGAM|nr:hypothetical protein DFH94DRAFT_3537 [Russula ochroleuca]
MTDSDIIVHFPHESDMHAFVFFYVFARIESGINHDPSARAAAISAIDEEILDGQLKEVDEQLLRSLLTCRNTLAPISLLPPEALARVFRFLALEEQNPGWIRATHVCRFWREVALGDSSLWATISGIPTNTEWIPEMLARARNAPLDIDIDIGVTSNPEVLLVFPPHLSHTRELRLYSLSILHSDSVRAIYSREAPALEHFELGVSETSLIIFRDLGGTTLFKGQAPRLRTLFLSQVLIPWSLIPRGQLTQLTLSLLKEISIFDVPSHRNLYQLIDLLVHSPELEVLVLGCCLPPQLTQNPHGPTIHLPRLSSLCLAGSSSRITNLMKMLKVPSSTMLHFHCVSENTPTHHDGLLLPVVSAQLQSPARAAPIEFKYLSVSLSCMDRSLEVTASTSVPISRTRQSQDSECDIDDSDEFALSFDGLPELGDWTDLLEGVCKMLPISNIESLSISAFDIIDSVNWVDLFKRCTNVTTMQAIGRGTSGLVRALTTPKLTNTRRGGKGKKMTRGTGDSTPAQPARSTASHADAPIFPKLTFLSLKRLDFGEDQHPSGILFNVVEEGLRQRRVAYKAPLKILRIDNCAISAKRARALEKLVQKFDWDRKERLLDESGLWRQRFGL